jgi:prepilin-type N-terminal cleavage/methylation domain-containing protein/prepilin-type processing-associated H-X9-DG protein
MRKRPAFTIVELLTVIAIIGILTALLLPAVQSAREAARRLQCCNNLKQVGLAIHSFHGANNALPAGNVLKTAGVCPGNRPGVQSDDGANWLILILPYLEQTGLYASYDLSAYNEGIPNKVARETRVNIYVCPSDAENDKLMVPASGPAAMGYLELPYMPGSYRAMSGRSDGYRFLDSEDLTTYPESWRGAIHAVGAKGFHAETFASIRDGLSNTIIAGESTTTTNRGWRTFWAYSYAHFSLSAATPQARTLWGDYDAAVAAGGPGRDKPCKRAWGSYHPNGLNFLMCDGSVHFLATSIDMDLFTYLATIDGGEVSLLPNN